MQEGDSLYYMGTSIRKTLYAPIRILNSPDQDESSPLAHIFIQFCPIMNRTRIPVCASKKMWTDEFGKWTSKAHEPNTSTQAMIDNQMLWGRDSQR